MLKITAYDLEIKISVLCNTYLLTIMGVKVINAPKNHNSFELASSF